MEIAIVSDSHIPSRAQEIPAEFRERIEEADHVLHAGDFDSEGAYASVADLAPELTAVHGNVDPNIGLPTTTTVELGGVEFVLTHGTGDHAGWADRVTTAVSEHASNEDAVGVAGHTHELTDTVHDGVRLLNPGSVTGANPADRPTMLTAVAEAGELEVVVRKL